MAANAGQSKGCSSHEVLGRKKRGDVISWQKKNSIKQPTKTQHVSENVEARIPGTEPKGWVILVPGHVSTI